jgi:uncharacterized protein YndB with AHSA1/START domain
MKPVTVSTTVPEPREDVFEFIDVLGNHQAFTDHFLVDWKLAGPRAGVGARARMRVKKPGPADWLQMEVIDSDPPRSTTEESVSGNGRRRTRGTYVLEERPDGGTSISFELAWLAAPLSDRLIAPLTRAVVRRSNATSLRRLTEALTFRRDEPRAGEPTDTRKG